MAGKRRIRRRWVVLALLAAAAGGGAAWWYFALYRPSRVDVQIADFLAEPNRRNAERLANSLLVGKGTEAEQSKMFELLAMPQGISRSAYPPEKGVWVCLSPSLWVGLISDLTPILVPHTADGKWDRQTSAHSPVLVIPSSPHILLASERVYDCLNEDDVLPGLRTEAMQVSVVALSAKRFSWAWPSQRAGWQRWIPRREQQKDPLPAAFDWTVTVPLNIVEPGQGETIERLEGDGTGAAVRKAIRLEKAEVVYPPPGNPLPRNTPFSLAWKDMPCDCVFRVSSRGLEGVRGPDEPQAIFLRKGSSWKLDSFASPYWSRQWKPHALFERPQTPDGYTGAIVLTLDFETAWCFPEVKAICAETIELPVKVTVLAPPAASRPVPAGRNQ